VYNDSGQSYASQFTYHPSGGLTSYRAGNNVVTTVDYDEDRYWLGRIEVTPSAVPFRFDYTHSRSGNIEQIADPRAGMTQIFTVDPLDRLASVTAGGGYPSATFAFDGHGNRQAANLEYDPANPFRLRMLGGLGPLTYDDNGNLTGGFGGTYQHTPDNRLQESSN
jgi:hypothetical protein